MHKTAQQGDEYFCHVCNRRWGVNENAPADCVDENEDMTAGDDRANFIIHTDSKDVIKPSSDGRRFMGLQPDRISTLINTLEDLKSECGDLTLSESIQFQIFKDGPVTSASSKPQSISVRC